jgi:hypothetical protein
VQVDILKNESTAKDKALSKERQAHALASVQRDGEIRTYAAAACGTGLRQGIIAGRGGSDHRNTAA